MSDDVETQEQRLYNPNDNITGRDGGPYLDIEEAKAAERRRAEVEGREPDFEDMPATAGIPLVPGPTLLATASVNNLPSQSARFGLNVAESVEKVQESEDSDNTLKAWAVREVPVSEPENQHGQVRETTRDEQTNEPNEEQQADPSDPNYPMFGNDPSEQE